MLHGTGLSCHEHAYLATTLQRRPAHAGSRRADCRLTWPRRTRCTCPRRACSCCRVGQPQHRRGGRWLWRRNLRALPEAPAAPGHGDARGAQRDLRRLPVQQSRGGGAARSLGTGVQPRCARARGHRGAARQRDRRGHAGAHRDTRAGRTRALRPARARTGHRLPLGSARRLRRGRRRAHATRVEGRAADAAAARPVARHARGRRGGDVGDGRTVPLPAGPLRAREPHRGVPAAAQAAREAAGARQQQPVLEAATVPAGVA